MSTNWRALFAAGAVLGVSLSVGARLAADGAASPDAVDRRVAWSGSPQPDHSLGSAHGYDLARLKLLEPTLFHVEESYVEPLRIDWKRMYIAGLQAVERDIPAFRFHWDDRSADPDEPDDLIVAIEIGDFRTVLPVHSVGTRGELFNELRRIAHLLATHLRPSDLPPSDAGAKSDETGWGGPAATIEYSLVNGILGTLDPHSMLLPPPDADQMDVENEGEFGGLGVTIVEGEGRLVVEAPMADSPAGDAGILAGDVLMRIDGQSTINMSLDDAVHLLRGPVGQPITLEIRRDGRVLPEPLELVRRVIKLNAVEGALLDGDIGLISIRSFHAHVETELHAVLARMRRESSGGIKGVVLDLRSNPGGYLQQAVRVSDTFLRSGEIVSTVDRHGRRRDVQVARPHPATEPAYPMAVLVDAGSASAAEIVAGALRNNDRAVIIGERSFGKGSVQNLHRMYDESKLKLTISRYLTPGERSIQATGIPADVELIPVRMQPAEEDAPFSSRVYWRENVRREADLDNALDAVDPEFYEPAYRLRYLDARGKPTDGTLDRDDPQVRLARDLLLAAPTASRRSEILAASGRVVDVFRGRVTEEVAAAFKANGVDWSRGRDGTVDADAVTARLSYAGGRTGLVAGIRQRVTLELTNNGSEDLRQLAVLAHEHDILDGREFVFGRLAAGETASKDVVVDLLDGYPSGDGMVDLTLREGSGEILGELHLPVKVLGHERPELEWTWKWDGPLAPQPGDTLRLVVEVHNRGAGPTADAFVRLRNRSGAALDLVEGVLEPGSLATADGRSCPEVDRATGCQRRLGAGASWSGELSMVVREPRRDGWPVELTVGDGESFDHATVVGAGFYEYFTQSEPIVLGVTTDEHVRQVRSPPRLQISRLPIRPDEDASGPVQVSGLVEDDTGLAYVLVFGDGDKLFYGSGPDGVRALPFTASMPIEPDADGRFTVVAVDEDGMRTTRTVVAGKGEPPIARQLP